MAMKLLMTADTVGGVWTYALELCRALEAHGVEVSLATMGAPLRADQWRQVECLSNVLLYESSFKLEWMQDPWDDVRKAGKWLLELERQEQPDVIHLNGYVHGSLPWSTPVLAVGHSCVLSWWQAVKGGPAPRDWNVYRVAVEEGLRRVHRVVAPSAAMLAALRRHYGPLPRAKVIHNARSAGTCRRGHKEALIFSAGRLWDEAKNLAALDHAASRVPWPVFVAGDDTCPDGRPAAAQHATLLGRQDEAGVARWLSRAAIYCLPARYEPFGLSVLEAALSGCALVLGDIDSLREVWADAAIFVPPNDHGALERAIRLLIDSPLQREALAQRAIERAQRYTPGRMAQGYFELYRELAGSQAMAATLHD